VIHTVRLANLTAGSSYSYRVAGAEFARNFTMPVTDIDDLYPFAFALTADLGQTAVSQANVHNLLEIATSEGAGRGVVLLSGDLSYADGFGQRWDTYARMMEPLASAVPVMTTGGNHEYGDGEGWTAYDARYPMPHRSSSSVSNLWWSRDIGPVHVIGLCSYAATAAGSLQYEWLAADLAGTDRAATPWVLVMMHAPWYNSNSGHVAEAELMRRSMEPLLYEYGVDIVLSGHVHAYERIEPVLNGCLNPCGPVYLNLGDGGNYEGTYVPWREPPPPWSAFRESSFGVGGLVVINASHATYTWRRSACEGSDEPSHINFNRTCESIVWSDPGEPRDNSAFASVQSDSAWIVRPRPVPGAASCPPLPSDLSPETACSVAGLPPPGPAATPPSPPERAASFGVGALVATGIGGVFVGAALVGLPALVYRMQRGKRRPQPLLIEPFVNPAAAHPGASNDRTHVA